MSVDRSLKIKGALERHRNVLTRAERVAKLKDEERWQEDNSLFGLPKVAHRKSRAGRKEAEEKPGVETPAGEVPVAPPAPEAKGKAPESKGKKKE